VGYKQRYERYLSAFKGFAPLWPEAALRKHIERAKAGKYLPHVRAVRKAINMSPVKIKDTETILDYLRLLQTVERRDDPAVMVAASTPPMEEKLSGTKRPRANEIVEISSREYNSYQRLRAKSIGASKAAYKRKKREEDDVDDEETEAQEEEDAEVARLRKKVKYHAQRNQDLREELSTRKMPAGRGGTSAKTLKRRKMAAEQLQQLVYEETKDVLHFPGGRFAPIDATQWSEQVVWLESPLDARASVKAALQARPAHAPTRTPEEDEQTIKELMVKLEKHVPYATVTAYRKAGVPLKSQYALGKAFEQRKQQQQATIPVYPTKDNKGGRVSITHYMTAILQDHRDKLLHQAEKKRRTPSATFNLAGDGRNISKENASSLLTMRLMNLGRQATKPVSPLPVRCLSLLDSHQLVGRRMSIP
jgi:hypothetical protein